MNKTTNIQLRLSQERGQADHGWLKSYHSFSFADYYDAKHMGFRSLRVINEDWIEGGRGFGAHPHRDMEILTYVIKGALAHKDSMGTESVIKAGDVQKMSAGTGITHSEFNASATEKTHLLQIWILPEKNGLKPSYQQFALPAPSSKSPLQLIASPKGGENIILFHQDVDLYRGIMRKGQEYVHPIASGRGVWVQMINGDMDLNAVRLKDGDAAAVEHEKNIVLNARADSEFLLFDLK